MLTFQHTVNRFGGVIIDPESLPDETSVFTEDLYLALETWREESHKLVWLEVPITQAMIVPIATEAGFVFHHATETYLMMVYRLVDGAFVPDYATHHIGAGGVVINDKNELLVVSERHRRDTSRPYYKLPGGALNPREHVVDGVIREVYEETGVKTKFETLVCFRHWHGYRYGKSDMYMICRLSPLSDEIVAQESEIEECLWMPVEEYLINDYVGSFNRRIVELAINHKGFASGWFDGYENRETHEFFVPQEIF